MFTKGIILRLELSMINSRQNYYVFLNLTQMNGSVSDNKITYFEIDYLIAYCRCISRGLCIPLNFF